MKRTDRGATIVESLVALTFTGVFATLIYSFCDVCWRSASAQQARSDAQETAAAALEWITRDLRQAGYDATGAARLGLGAAEANRVEVRADLNGDGDCDDPNETVAYAADPVKQTLTRTLSGGTPQPLIDHLVPDSLRFTYRDAGGAVLSPGTGGLDLTQRTAVRRIDVELTVAIPSRDPHLRDVTRLHVQSSVALRNAPST